jgi:hypothetical protein
MCAGRELHNGLEWENHKLRDNLEDTVVAGRIILRYLKKWDAAVLVWIDVAVERGHIACCHGHNRTHLSSKKASGFLGYQRTNWPTLIFKYQIP